MAATTRADLARAMFIGTKEVFKKLLKRQSVEYWKSCVTIKTSDKDEEIYDSIGNLKPAHEKTEEGEILYGKIQQANATIIRNRTWVNGLETTMEVREDEKWGAIPLAKSEELMRTIIELREENVANVINNVPITVGADGVPLASAVHPLLNSPLVNNNILNGVFNIANYETAVQMFNVWRNHYGQRFHTMPDKMLMHPNREVMVAAMLESVLRAFEASNTKNTTYRLKPVFNKFLNVLPVNLIDSTIDSFVFQRRKNIVPGYDYDERSTLKFFFNLHERYMPGTINPGFGFLHITGV